MTALTKTTRSRTTATRIPKPPSGLEINQLLAWRASDFWDVAWSPDGTLIAAGGGDGCIWLFDASTGSARLIEGHAEMIRALAWSPDSRRIASVGYDEVLQVWDVASGAALFRVTVGGHGTSVAWSPDGAQIAAGFGEGSIQVCSATSGATIRTLTGHRRYVWHLAWSADGALLASGSLDHHIRIWSLDKGETVRVLRGHRDCVRGIAWSPGDRELASISDDRTVRIWNLKSGCSRSIQANADWLSQIAWSSSGWLAYCSRRATIHVWNPNVELAPKPLRGESGWVRGLSWSPNGELLAARGPADTLTIWNRVTGEAERRIESCRGIGDDIQWSPDGRQLALGHRDGVDVVRLRRGTASVKTLPGNRRGTPLISWSPTGRMLAQAGTAKGIRIWRPEDRAQVGELAGHSTQVTALAWSPDERILTSGSYDGTILNWDVTARARVGRLQGHTAAVWAVAWCPKGRLAASGSEDRTIRIWDVHTEKTERIFEGHSAPVTTLAWSRNGEFLVSGAKNGELRLWRLRDGALLAHRDGVPFRQSPRALFFGKTPQALKKLGKLGIFSTVWKPNALFGAEAPAAISSAKIVLVGDSDVGKSCLALRLAERRFEQRGATHGMQIWSLTAAKLRQAQSEPHLEQQEVFLWDLGGQAEYQLVHQLFLHDTTAAMVLFDATRGTANYDAIEDWNRRLDVQAHGRPLQKLLVRTKTDLTTGVVDQRKLQALKDRCGFAGYCEVSALTGQGIDALVGCLTASLALDQAAKITRPALYQTIRYIIQQERASSAIIFYRELCKRLRGQQVVFRVADLDTVLRQLALEGQIVDILLAQGDRVLVLRIEVVSRYASSLVLAARDNPRGLPVLEPQRVLSPTMGFPGLKEDERLERATERVVVECVVQILLERGLCFQQGGVLIFPTLFPQTSLAETDQLPLTSPLYYDFDGPIDNIYAGLVAQMALSGEWGKVKLWSNLAQFEETNRGIFAIARHDRGRCRGHLDLYVSADVDPTRRSLFVSFVEDYLRTRDVDVLQGLSFDCDCSKFHFSEDLLRNRLTSDKETVTCPQCDKQYPLFRPATSKNIASHVRALKTETSRRSRKTVADVKEAMASAASDQSRPIRILHLSDLHLEGSRSVDQLLQPIESDLHDVLDVDTLDYLVLTGDLADRCNPVGFERAQEFIEALVASFSLNSSRLVIVPGNHDLDRDHSVYALELDEKKALLVPEHARLRKEDVYLVRNETEYPRRFEKFRRCYKALTQSDYPLEHSKQGLVIPFPEDGVEFLTLNSAWEIDRFNQRRVSINSEALAQALLKTHPDMKLRIVVWHHSVSGSRMVANPEIIDRLIAKGYRLCMHGDVHEERNELRNYLDTQRTFHVAGTGSFSSREAGLPGATPRLYNLIEVDRTFHQVHIRSRAQRKLDGPFAPHAIYPGGDDPEVRRGDYWIRLEVGS